MNQQNTRILIVEDEPKVALFLKRGLEENGYSCEIALDGKDSGIGIDIADIDNIFHPFFRAKNAKNIYGNGLGLPLADKIIKLHRGVISIESQLQKGTTITVTIPFLS